MELDPALLTEFKTLRLHPLVQRRELMFGMALAASNKMQDAERTHDTAHAEILALARAQFANALIEKGMQPDAVEQVLQHVESHNTQVSGMILEMVSSLATIRRTSEQRDQLPAHMQNLPSFATEKRLGQGMQPLLGDSAKSYEAMMHMLTPSDYVNDHHVIIGEVKRDDVLLTFNGTRCVESAERMKAMLNTLKTEFSAPGLFVSVRKDQPSRGTVYGASTVVGSDTLKALVDAYTNEPERFAQIAKSVANPGRAID